MSDEDNTTEDTPERDDRILAAEYVLGLLEGDEARAFEARLNREPELRTQFAEWSEDFVELSEALPAATPPGYIRGQLINTLFEEPRPSFWQRLNLWQYLGGAVAASLLAYVVINQTPAPAIPEFQARIVAEDQSLRVVAEYDVETRRMILGREAGGVAAGRAQELWLIVGEAAPVSLGLLAATGLTEIEIPEAQAADIRGAVLAISDEPAGGSPTGAPTGAVLALGPITPV